MPNEDPLKDAEILYNEPLDPKKTKEIEQLLKRASVKDQPSADVTALEAIVTLCDYLNRWNGAGKMDLATAEKEIDTALAINPNLAAAYYAKGFIFRTRGDHKNALAAFQKSLSIDPNNPRAIAQEGAEYLYNGDPVRALASVRKALDISPNHPASGMFHWIEARALFFDGKYKESIPPLQQSIKTWSTLWYSQAYEVSAFALIGDIEEARRKLQVFIEHFPDLTTVARIVQAEQTNPNKNPFVVKGRSQFHEGLRIAGMPPGEASPHPVDERK